ncbi:hypothetical protein BCV70DRAFT_230440 [Testicularia cyperi]|uniref:Uncharacterized protein n=1 Tax=Testicularia cyperi TaxID=1882483 RepID=A0A317XWN9_9BASI|nr:hypothetical protein BCV70DRAFT_230440 [Testicularia cyperi]
MKASVLLGVASLTMAISTLPRADAASPHRMIRQHKRDDDHNYDPYLYDLCFTRADIYKHIKDHRGVACQRTTDHWYDAANVDIGYQDSQSNTGGQRYDCVYMRADGNESDFWTWTPNAGDFCAIWDEGWCDMDEENIDLVCPPMSPAQLSQYQANEKTKGSTAKFYINGHYIDDVVSPPPSGPLPR